MRNIGLVIVLLGLLAANMFAGEGGEAATVRLTGQVVDQDGASVVGARVLAEKSGTSIRVEAMTDGSGVYSLNLSRGKYVIHISAAGFDEVVKPVELDQAELSLPPISLGVASATAMVTVGNDGIYTVSDTSTATKTYTLLRDIPQSMTVIKRDQLIDQNANSIADIVRYVPGIQSHQGENNRDEVIIRGNKSNADFFRDGVRDDVQYYRDPYNTESFEALKGPNAMIFGRGGGGGVINRVTKQAKFAPIREFSATGGSYRDRRFTGDFGQAISKSVAFRVNGLYEGSRSFRDFVILEREGINPTISISPDAKTSINVGYEFFRDRRTADRGITSFQGKPAEVPIDTYYGDPKQTYVRANVNLVNASVERLLGDVIFRSRTQYGYYDRGYQNFVPGPANAAGTLVTLTAYNNATKRGNLFNQTDLTYSFATGGVKHTVVGGTELGRQSTDNFRNTGYFNNATTSIQVAFNDPTTTVPVTFKQSATDADNHLTLNLGAAFVQDQIQITPWLQAIAGVRYDYFDLTYHNNRNGDTISRTDKLISPRLGLVLKPVTPVSIYGSYAVSYLPSSGDQFSSLTAITQQVKPEKFENYEAGVKWDINSRFALTSALYRLDRTNTRSTDPNDPTKIIQTGSQRTTGFELGLAGSVTKRWSLSGGYAWQNARIISATTAAPAGSQIPLVPRNSVSLWNKYQITRRLGAGLGLIYRTDVFAAIDNTVVLPGYLKLDGAVFYTLNEHWRLQANLENLTNKRYFVNADSNTNISPGAPRGVKVGLVARF